MRTTLEEPANSRSDGAHNEHDVARDNPRRQREPDNDSEADDRPGNGASRSPRRHSV